MSQLYAVVECPSCHAVQVSTAFDRVKCQVCSRHFRFFEKARTARDVPRSNVHKTFPDPKSASDYCKQLKLVLAEKRGEKIGHKGDLEASYNWKPK